MNSEKTLLEISGLKKYFPVSHSMINKNRKYLKAVDDVSLSIHEGEICGLVGESGCGKSTLGRCALRLHTVTEGSVVFDGQHIEHLSLKQTRPLRAKMQIIFQDPYAALNPRMSVMDSVKAPLDTLSHETEDRKRKMANELLDYVGITSQHRNKYPHELSGGQRQRVVIARAMITNPRFVVCDEPVSALDVSVRSQVLNLMKRMQRETGVSYLFISHDLSVVKYLCDTVAVMYLGKLVEMAGKAELFANPRHPYTRALISAIPVPDIHHKAERMILKGDIPSPVNPPSGCYFHTRCPYATERCEQEQPTLEQIAPGHFAACHRKDI